MIICIFDAAGVAGKPALSPLIWKLVNTITNPDALAALKDYPTGDIQFDHDSPFMFAEKIRDDGGNDE